jgi:hypothetical protein
MITLNKARYCTPMELECLRRMKATATPEQLARDHKESLFYDFDWNLPMFDLMEVLQAHADSQSSGK